jgi:SAM-dependent methyltransferase
MRESDLFPTLEEEVGRHKDLLVGKVLNAGAGHRDLAALVRGEVTNQDIPQGLHSANIHIYSPLHEIPREDGYFDVVFCNAVLEHVENPEEVIREFARVCRPGGLLYLCVPFMQPEHKDPTDFQRYTAEGLIALVQRQGFVVEKVEAMHNVYTTLAWLVLCWLSASRCLRNVLLNWILFQPLCYLSRHGKEQVFATASAYRVIARRLGQEPQAGTPR